MNRILKGLIIIILSSACLVSYGQDKKTKGEKPSKELLAARDSIKQKDAIISLKDSLIAELSAKHQGQIDSMSCIIEMKDSLIAAKDAIIAEFEANHGYVDTCIVKFANRCLYQKFNKDEVNDAIKYFENIHSETLKADLAIVLELLSSYESSYNAFLDLLKEAQSDQEIHSPFAVYDYKEKYLGAIRNLDYYKKYYGKAWTIKYLDKLIDEAINRLEKHDSTNYNSLKFNDID